MLIVIMDTNNNSSPVRPKFKLRHYQRVPAKEIISYMAAGDGRINHRVLFHAPTGAGKTRTAMSVVSMHFRLYGPTMILWLASTTELVSQAASDFKKAWEHHGDIEAVLIEWRGGTPSFDVGQAPVRNTMVIAGLQFLVMLAARKDSLIRELQENISLIVFDEAHQSIANTYKDLVNSIMAAGKCKLLGLSATPGRTEGDKATTALSDMYGNKKVSIDHNGYPDPISFLVGNKYLSKPNFIFPDFNSNIQCSDKNDADTSIDSDYSEDILENLGAQKGRNNKIVNIVCDIIQAKHTRILVFVPSIASAVACDTMLRTVDNGIRDSMAVSGRTVEGERRNVIRRYMGSSLDPHVIFNVRVLTTGFDAPKTSAVVIARPTKSMVLYSQMVGRALRGPKSGGNEESVIYTIVDDNFEQFNDVAKTFLSWDKYWRNENE